MTLSDDLPEIRGLKPIEALKNILAINGSAAEQSINQKLLKHLATTFKDTFDVTFLEPLKNLPHFDPACTLENVPEQITSFRNLINSADGVLICSPEYVFSIPSGLKNLIEWCVSTTVFAEKPVALITASTSGQKAHEELQLLMQTLGAKMIPETTLLISGIKSKLNEEGIPANAFDSDALQRLLDAFRNQINGVSVTGQSSSH
jgi:NAD(P)H-dependent FMN reductase